MSDDEQVQLVRSRLSETMATLTAMDGVWPHITRELQRKRLAYLETLVVAEDQELRGRIKEIDELLRMPQYLRMEIENLSNSLPKSGEL